MADSLRNARLAFIKVGSATLSAETGSSITLQADLIETTNKGDTQFKSFIHDIVGATATAAGYTNLDTTTGDISSLEGTFLDNIIAGTAATLIFVLQESGPTTTITASSYVTEWTNTGNQGEVIQGNYAFQLTGTITVTETNT